MFQRNYYMYKNEKIVKMMELAEIAPLTPSVRDMTLFKFNESWKPFMDFFVGNRKKDVMIYHSEN